MGHSIRGIIGERAAVEALTAGLPAEVVELPQGFAMAFLTDRLWDAVEEAFPAPPEPDCPCLLGWTAPVRRWLEEGSRTAPLAYIETDYFGGHGTQAGALAEKGRVAVPPAEGEGTIDRLLAALGVRCLPGKDEFDSLGLGGFRHLPLPDME